MRSTEGTTTETWLYHHSPVGLSTDMLNRQTRKNLQLSWKPWRYLDLYKLTSDVMLC